LLKFLVVLMNILLEVEGACAFEANVIPDLSELYGTGAKWCYTLF
jgi:hypothetical protein